jgi:glycosyltransferase involved in cell wall biosynthesis
MTDSDEPIHAKSGPVLCIVIPTFNRAEFLDQCLAFAVEAIAHHAVPICISDNCSTDNTADVVEKWLAVYPLICYSRNDANMGPDKNFEMALKMGQADYVWLLGDTYRITRACVDHVIAILMASTQGPDVVVLNAAGRVTDVPGTVFTDANQLLSRLGWHMTCMSSLVYRRDVLAKAPYARFRSTNFIQVGIIFESIENRSFSVEWVADQSVYPINIAGVVKESWRARVLQVWVERWSNFVMSLPPSYALATKLACIKAHNSKSGLFSIGSMLSLRAENAFDWAVMGQFSNYLALNPARLIAARLIALLPANVASALLAVRRCFISVKN